MTLTTLDLTIAGTYVAGVLALGVWISGRIGGFRDYFVAGGRMTTPILVCTLVSTYYGLDVLFGGSEVGYQEGVVGWFWYTRPYYVAILVAAALLARRLKRYDFLSLPDIAAGFYGRGTQSVVAVASFVYALPLLALMGMGVLLDVVLGVPFIQGVIFGALISVIYTLLGGLLADALTDTVQFTLMCVTLGVAAALVLEGMGGPDALRDMLPASYFDPQGTYPLPVLLVFSLGALSVLVEPGFYQRIFAAESSRSVLVALAIGVVLWAAFDWITNLMGMAAAAAGLEVEPSYALLTLTLDVLPVGLKGLFVAGVVATAMSTIDSYLLIAGGNLSYDLWRPLVRPDMPDRALLSLTRWMVVVASVVAVGLALVFPTIVSAWVFMSTVLVAAAFVPVMAGLYLPFPPRAAAGLAGSVTGLVVVLLFYALTNAFGTIDPEWGTRIWAVEARGRRWEIWQDYAVLVALPASAVAFVLGHAFGRRPGGSPPLAREAGEAGQLPPSPHPWERGT